MRAEAFINSRFRLAESPLLLEGRLYWVDIEGDGIYYFDGGVRLWKGVKTPTTIAPWRGGLIYTSFRSVVVGEKEFPISDEGVRFNDGKCSPEGELWVGTMDLDEREPKGRLYAFNGKGFRRLVEGLIISNGLDWLDDEFYLVDSPRRAVFVYSYPSLTLKGKIDTSSLPGVPDGLTVDSEGRIWVAHYGGGMVSVWEGGKLVDKVEVPVKLVTSVVLSEGGELYITTSGRDGVGGQIYRARVNARGRKHFECVF